MTITTRSPQWFLTRPRKSPARLRLFCFPYAGGGTPIYRDWQRLLPEEVEVCAAQLPGRGTRLQEPAFTDAGALVEALADAITPLLDLPFALFGHSMGAVIGFELARLLRDRPAHLFVSGRPGPQSRLERDRMFDLPEDLFWERLRRLNGTPAEVIEHPELRELMLPMLRADFSVVETYVYRPGPPLDIPLTAFGGVADAEVSREQVEAWGRETTGPFAARLVPGDHFFLNDPWPRELMLREIARGLRAFR